MRCKKVYLGEEIDEQVWKYGLGSIYLAGPKNEKGKSWRSQMIKKIESEGVPVTIFIPETRTQLKGSKIKMDKTLQFSWKHTAISLASTIVFWYPSGNLDHQSYVEFGVWSRAERIFYGREDEAQNEYLDWLLYKQQLLYPAETMDQVVEMVIHWLKE